MLKIERVVSQLMEVNAYVVSCGQEAVVIDPAGADPELLQYLRQSRVKVVAIINTHGHGDHIAGNQKVQQLTDAPLWIHDLDTSYLADPQLHLGPLIGLDISPLVPDRCLQDEDVIPLGSCALQVLHTPGHTPGGICLYGPGALVCGDTLFWRSLGRTDLPGGNKEDLMQSIQSRLLSLPDETRVYPGHGPETSIGDERDNNPYL